VHVLVGLETPVQFYYKRVVHKFLHYLKLAEHLFVPIGVFQDEVFRHGFDSVEAARIFLPREVNLLCKPSLSNHFVLIEVSQTQLCLFAWTTALTFGRKDSYKCHSWAVNYRNRFLSDRQIQVNAFIGVGGLQGTNIFQLELLNSSLSRSWRLFFIRTRSGPSFLLPLFLTGILILRIISIIILVSTFMKSDSIHVDICVVLTLGSAELVLECFFVHYLHLLKQLVTSGSLEVK